MPLLRRVDPDAIPSLRTQPVDAETLAAAAAIVRDVQERGEAALREHATRLGDLEAEEDALAEDASEDDDELAPLVLDEEALEQALDWVPEETRALLQRTAERITRFAEAQRAALVDVEREVLGGRAGHTVRPVRVAGCYAPGGRFPLPSSVLMTALTARAAGVETVFVASPRPSVETLAAAAIAGADGLLVVGGAQAIAALAYGVGGVPACDVIVGPGNRWVTAAKQLVAGHVRIDMLAGPSELVVLADATADPATIAADLLAQAEHDDDAVPVLVTTDRALIDAVEAELAAQLAELPTAATARNALRNGYAVLAVDLDQAIALCDRVAPEHLEVCTADPRAVARRLTRYGGLFIGTGSAEVFGDYGVGPNHTLPTAGTARYTGGLSVLDFLAVRTWLDVEPTDALVDDAVAMARMEGLEGHARSALRRRR